MNLSKVKLALGLATLIVTALENYQRYTQAR